jgi:hypothetical protein
MQLIFVNWHFVMDIIKCKRAADVGVKVKIACHYISCCSEVTQMFPWPPNYGDLYAFSLMLVYAI